PHVVNDLFPSFCDMKHIGFLVFPDFNILDLSGPLAAFDVPRHEVTPAPYRLTAFSEKGGPIVSSCGVSVNTVALGRTRLDTFVAVRGRRAAAPGQRPGKSRPRRGRPKTAPRQGTVGWGTLVRAQAGRPHGEP